MSTPTRSQSETDALAAQAAIKATANALFIAAADIQIQAAIAQGKFFANCETIDDIDPKTIFEYYANLGYGVRFPDYPTNLALQPAELFGAYWINFWSNGGFVPDRLKKPYRLIISWTNSPLFLSFPV